MYNAYDMMMKQFEELSSDKVEKLHNKNYVT